MQTRFFDEVDAIAEYFNECDRADSSCGEALDNEIANGDLHFAVVTAPTEPDPAEDGLIVIHFDSCVATCTGG